MEIRTLVRYAPKKQNRGKILGEDGQMSNSGRTRMVSDEDIKAAFDWGSLQPEA